MSREATFKCVVASKETTGGKEEVEALHKTDCSSKLSVKNRGGGGVKRWC